MIIGIGIDIVDMRILESVLNSSRHHFTEGEIELAGTRPGRFVQTLGKRFAVKEAVIKALGVDDSIGGVHPIDIEVKLTNSGRPIVHLTGGAAKQLIKITPFRHVSQVSVSITDEGVIAAAVALIHAQPLA